MIRAAVFVSIVAAALPARADRWRLDGKLGTEVPLDLGAKLDAEAPYGLKLSSSVGFLPVLYLDALNGFLVGAGAYSDQGGQLVRASLAHALVWRTHAGYRLWRGLYAMAGYGLVILGGGTTSSDLITAADGMPLPPSDGDAPRALTVHARLHMLDVEAGWTLDLPEKLELQVAVGGAFTVGAASTITPDYTPAMPAATRAYAAAGEKYLDHVLTSAVFTPVVSVMLGYPF